MRGRVFLVSRRRAALVLLACALAPSLAEAKVPTPPTTSVESARPPQSIDPGAIERARAAAVASGDFQTQLPGPRLAQPRRDTPRWLISLLESIGKAVAFLFKPLLWLLGAAAVAALAYVLIPAFRDWVDRWRRRRPRGATEPAFEPFDDAVARDLLAEADALAASGRFGEAAQLLLTRSVEEISRRRPAALTPADTARAIAVLGDVPPQPRGAFATLARIVERARWARLAIGADDWSAARAAWHDIADRRGWVGA